MGPVIKGTIFGAIVAYVWVVISWMVLPWHQNSYQHFKSPASVITTLERNITEKGVYIFPSPENMNHQADEEAENKVRHKHRPRMFVFAAINPSIEDSINILTFVKAFLGQLVTALFITILTRIAHLSNYFSRVFYILGIAFAAGCAVFVPFYVWWQFSSIFITISFADHMVTWLLAGLVIAGFTGRKTPVVGLQ